MCDRFQPHRFPALRRLDWTHHFQLRDSEANAQDPAKAPLIRLQVKRLILARGEVLIDILMKQVSSTRIIDLFFAQVIRLPWMCFSLDKVCLETQKIEGNIAAAELNGVIERLEQVVNVFRPVMPRSKAAAVTRQHDIDVMP